MNLAPVVVFTYTRFIHLKKVVASLQANHLAKFTDLYVVSDGASRPEDEPLVQNIRNWAKQIKGFQNVEVICRENNFGAFNSIVEAEKYILRKYGKIICLEDDIITSKNFLAFMNSGLSFYYQHPNVLTISGYSHPINPDTRKDFWVCPYHCPWGYATWEHKWSRIDYHYNPYNEMIGSPIHTSKAKKYGKFLLRNLKADLQQKICAADARICAQMVINNSITIMPSISKVQNIGHDGSGLHSAQTNKFWVELDQTDRAEFHFDENPTLNEKIIKRYERYMRGNFLSELLFTLSDVKGRLFSR